MAGYDNVMAVDPTDFSPEGEVMDVSPPDDYLTAFETEQSTEDDPQYDVEAATAAFLRMIRETYTDDVRFDTENRQAALEDLKFFAGDQWPDNVKRKRKNRRKPILTLNRLPAYVAQVVNQRRANEAGINVIPDTGGDVKKANIRQGLIRSIEKRCRAQEAYNRAHLNQVVCGDGSFGVDLEYADEDVFEQEIKIKAVPDAMSVVWDRMSVEPTGKDATHCFVEDFLTKTEFKLAYPQAKVTDFSSSSTMVDEARGEGWVVDDTVRVVAFWRMRSEMHMLALVYKEGAEDRGETEVIRIDGVDPATWVPRAVLNEATGRPYVRRSRVRFAERYITNGIELLEGPFRLPIYRVPMFRTMGWEIYIGQNRQRFGLIRFLKDPQRMHNYWRSIVVEKLMQTPRPKWIAPDSAVAGREEKFRKSAQTDDPLLVYNGEAGVAPQLLPPAQMESAMIQEAGMASQDIRDISNLHEAALGAPSNEVSGRAITARQQVSEVGVAVYQDNLNAAIEECGRVINQLIPYVYDTARKVRILGADDKEELVAINEDDENDITVGKYDVTVITGPSYATRRREAAESMLNMVNAMPDTLSVAADKIIEAQDWPEAQEIARRLRLNLPTGLVDPDSMSEEEKAMRASRDEEAAEAAAMQKRAQEVEIANKAAQAEDYKARAADAMARAAKTYAELDLNRLKEARETEQARYDMMMDGARFVAEWTDQGDENYGN
jgi:hypothetical protein